VYGAAGSLIVILLWVYYSAQIVFFGAEFTKVYARRFGAEAHERASTRDLDVSREIGDRPRQPDGLDGLGGVGLKAG